MSPNHKTKPGQSQKWFQAKLGFFDRFHWPQARLAWDRVQGSLPKDLGHALIRTLTLETKDLAQEIYHGDILEIGKAAKNGNLSAHSFLTGKLSSLRVNHLQAKIPSPVFNFLSQLTNDLSACPTPQEKATYLIKVASLFASAALGISAALNVATFGLAKTKTGGRPWIPSLGLVVGASVFARLLGHALEHIPEDSNDRQLADFLKANFEIIAFGGSLGVLETPEFITQSVNDPALSNLKNLIQEIFGEDALRDKSVLISG